MTISMLDKEFLQGITRKYAFVSQHRHNFPTLFHLKLRFGPVGHIHYLILKKKYITVLPQVLNRVYSFNFQLHFKLYRFSRQYTSVFPGPLSMDKQVNMYYGSPLSVDISHISHNSYNSRVTWIQNALRALSQIDRFHRSSDAQTTSLQSYTTIKDTFVGAGFPRPSANADTSLAHLFPDQQTYVYPRSNSYSSSFSYLYPYRYTGDQDTAFPIFQGSTLTGIENETFEIVQKLVSKLHFDHTHSNDRNMTFIKGVGGTLSWANTMFSKSTVRRGGVNYNAPTVTTERSQNEFQYRAGNWMCRSVILNAPFFLARTVKYPIPALAEGTTVFNSMKSKEERNVPGETNIFNQWNPFQPRIHTDHTYSDNRNMTFITSIGGSLSWVNTRFPESTARRGGVNYNVPKVTPEQPRNESQYREGNRMCRDVILNAPQFFLESGGGFRFAPTFTLSPASFVGARSDFVFALVQGETVGYPNLAPAAGATVFEKEKLQMVQGLISKSHTDHTYSNDREIRFNTVVGGTRSWANTRFAPTFTTFTTFTGSPASFVGARSDFVFALMQSGTVGYPFPAPAAGTTIFEKEKLQMVQGLISKSHTDHTHSNDRAIRFETGVGGAISWPNTRFPEFFTRRQEGVNYNAPRFQTVTRRMKTTLSTVQNSQNYGLTTLHLTSGTTSASDASGKNVPKPVNLPQLDYFTPVGTFQPKTETSLAEREKTTVTGPGSGSMSSKVTDNSTVGKIPAIPGIDSAEVCNQQAGTIDFDRLTDRVYRMLESKITMEKEMRGW